MEELEIFFENSCVFRNTFLNMLLGTNVSVTSEKATYSPSAINISALVHNSRKDLFAPFLNSCWCIRSNLLSYNSEKYFVFVSAAMEFISEIEKNIVKLLDALKNLPAEISADSSKTYAYILRVTTLLDSVEKNVASLNYTLTILDTKTSENPVPTPEDPTTPTTPLERIKKFMSSLSKSNLKGSAALDAAVKACSNFGSMQETINLMVEQASVANSATEFLENQCGIILDNADTGAITGSDAGGEITKTAESVVPETDGSNSYPPSKTFTVKGLTVTVPEKSTLTESQKNIVRLLYNHWIEKSLELIEESFSYSFNDNDVSVKEMEVVFYTDTTTQELAAVRRYYSDAEMTELGKLDLRINCHYYENLSADDLNGVGQNTSAYLDRTIAHEMTHAVMAAKIKYFDYLPLFIQEGTAELVHGIDDHRRSQIAELAGDSSKLQTYLDLNSTLKDVYIYAAGFMFLRYLAKQAAST